MEEDKGKQPVSAFKPRVGGLFGQRQKSSPAAERAAKAALLRSRMSVDSQRTHSLGRGTFLRGGRIIRGGRGAGAARAPQPRSPGAGSPAATFAFGQQQASASPASVKQAPSGLAEQATPARGQAMQPLSATPAGRLQGNALFNINAHLGLGGLAAARARSPPKPRSLVTSAAKPATGLREDAGAAAAAAAPEPTDPESTPDEDGEEMAPEQLEAERQAALANMPTFGGGTSGPQKAQPQPAAAAASQGTAEGKPVSSFGFGASQAPAFGASAASAAAGQTSSAPSAGAQQSAWLGLIRTQPASADASATAGQQPGPAGIFGRLGEASASASRLPLPQRAQDQQSAQAADAVDAKVRRSQRFGSNLASSAGNLPASMPQSSAAEASTAILDEDSGGMLRGAIVGTCEDMCPHAEIVARNNTQDVPIFERPNPRIAATTTELAVKRFARNVEQTPDNFRTFGAIQRTTLYLRKLMDSEDHPLVNIHKYLWDRFRGVRQDLFVQGFEGPEAIAMFEEHIRFMAMAEHELSEETTAAADQEAFNSHLNIEQINKACISLNAMYDKQRISGHPMPCEAEMRSYHLLTLMGTHGRYGYDGTEYTSALAGMPEEVLHSEEVQRVMAMQQALTFGNWRVFLRLGMDAPYLQGCLAHMYFPGVRARALNAMVAAGLPARNTDPAKIKEPPKVYFASDDLQRELHRNPEDILELCEKADLAIPNMMDPSMPFAIEIPKSKRFTTKDVPRRRSDVIGAKADGLRSTISLGLQGLTPEELHARQTRQEQLCQQGAQQEALHMREQQELQARLQQDQQRQRAIEMARQAAELAARQKEAEIGAVQQAIAAKEAELQRQQAEREQALQQEQRQQELQEQQEAERQRELQRRAEEERQRQELLEKQRQQRLRLEEERRAAELRAQQEAEEARRREEARRQAELEAKRREQELLRKEEEERQRRAAELRRRQMEGLKAVARKRGLRLARQSAKRWWQAVCRAKDQREQERRTLEALANVHVGIRAVPFKLHWAPDTLREDEAASSAAKRSAAAAGPTLNIKAAVGPTIAQRSPASTDIHWKLMVLHYNGPEHVDTVFQLREELSYRSSQSDGHVLARESFAVSHMGPSGERLVRTAVCDACPSLGPNGDMQSAMRGASAVLLLITDRDDPAVVDRRLTAAFAACRHKVPLLVLTSRIPINAIAAFIEQLLSSQPALADGVATHKVLRLPDCTSTAFAEVLSEGLQWLASKAPHPPELQVVLLREIALHWLRASERPSDRSTASLQETLHACNTALDRAAECIAQAPAAAWGWPPPETCDGSESIPATLGQQESQTRLKAALDRLQLPPLSDMGPAAGCGVAASESFQDYMQRVFGGHNAKLEPRSALLSAFRQSLHALDVPEVLSAVLPCGSWPPEGTLSSIREESFQLALPTLSPPSADGSIVRKRKGNASLAHTGRPPRKSKPEGSFAWGANSPGLPASAAAVTIPHDIFADLPEETPASASRTPTEALQQLKAFKRDLAAQIKANERLVNQLAELSSPVNSPAAKGAEQQSALASVRNLAAEIEGEILRGMEAQAGLQLSPALPCMGRT